MALAPTTAPAPEPAATLVSAVATLRAQTRAYGVAVQAAVFPGAEQALTGGGC